MEALLHYSFPACLERVRVFKDGAVAVDAVLMTTVMAQWRDLCQHQRLHIMGSDGRSHGIDFVDMSTMIRGGEGNPNAEVDLSASTDLVLPAKARGVKLGTLLVCRAIRFAHRHGHKDALVHGITLSPVDAGNPENRARRDQLWGKAGFQIPTGAGGPLSQFLERPDPSIWGMFRMQIDTVDAQQVARMFHQASKHEATMKDAAARAAEARDRLLSNASNERARLRRLAALGVLLGAVCGAAGMWNFLH